jgi:hypothetical protein
MFHENGRKNFPETRESFNRDTNNEIIQYVSSTIIELRTLAGNKG